MASISSFRSLSCCVVVAVSIFRGSGGGSGVEVENNNNRVESDESVGLLPLAYRFFTRLVSTHESSVVFQLTTREHGRFWKETTEDTPSQRNNENTKTISLFLSQLIPTPRRRDARAARKTVHEFRTVSSGGGFGLVSSRRGSPRSSDQGVHRTGHRQAHRPRGCRMEKQGRGGLSTFT